MFDHEFPSGASVRLLHASNIRSNHPHRYSILDLILDKHGCDSRANLTRCDHCAHHGNSNVWIKSMKLPSYSKYDVILCLLLPSRQPFRVCLTRRRSTCGCPLACSSSSRLSSSSHSSTRSRDRRQKRRNGRKKFA